VALLHERARGIPTFSVGFDDHPDIDERDEARRVAQHFATDHHEVVVSEHDAMEFLPGLIHHQDEPLADPVCLPLYFVCKLARDNGVPVVLAGEGSDELFWGYPSYQRQITRQQWMRAIMRLPRFARRLLPSLVPRGRYALVREVLEGFADGRPLPMQMPLGMTRDYRDRVLRAPGDSYGWGWEPTSTNGHADLADQLGFDTQEYEFGLRLPELLLMRIDRFSMANSVEARVPFLDPDLVEYVYRLPPHFKMRTDGSSKVVLRQAVSDIVPDWVLQRKKKGFGAPMASWLDAHMGQLFRSVMGDEAIQRYFDVQTLESVLARGGEARNAHYGLWPILNFALWHRYWIEQRPLDDLIAPVIAAAR
jgi:asparagine synthase (glutamine-hydrolysing)